MLHLLLGISYIEGSIGASYCRVISFVLPSKHVNNTFVLHEVLKDKHPVYLVEPGSIGSRNKFILFPKDADISKEAAEIQDYIETLTHVPNASILDLFQRKYAHSVIVGVGQLIFQQFGGINGIGFYASETFVLAVLKKEEEERKSKEGIRRSLIAIL
ncbi:hypothetical protein MRB53_020743 [Persea americana]|uniref:Uncharacterized protein n=1 Tax=Persea americana TaxID=3435 RepID=A0ACC2L223_PERAE|nr:hypothetical protein MRB53_020743 [Persea americana]